MTYSIKFYSYDGKTEREVGGLSYDGNKFRYSGDGKDAFDLYKSMASSPEELKNIILARLRSPYFLAVEQ